MWYQRHLSRTWNKEILNGFIPIFRSIFVSNGTAFRGGASPEKVGWKRDRMDGQKVYLTIFTSFLLRNE